uniref:Predicted ATPase, AAA+ ATPase superfamily n=1 Tax=Candidatus Kentrum sp. UNK TaxID=2126344 RepID=A0A451AJU9_9GAMM|nr:MAG: Predicted ATPase, AAA+ ATPase superfamily [Candidatus Kentron sp. UNK]VFK71196.1 MAG: Predicted ATPase, AAA+ ATPase superfamily [Candidatus Kentron sp. UNK]
MEGRLETPIDHPPSISDHGPMNNPQSNFRAQFGEYGKGGFLPLAERLDRIQPGENPFVVSDALPENAPAFFGRDRVMFGIFATLLHPRSGCVNLLGERGMGKSSLLNQVFATLRDEERLISIFADVRVWPAEYTPAAFFSDLHQAILPVLPSLSSQEALEADADDGKKRKKPALVGPPVDPGAPVGDYGGFQDFIRRRNGFYRFVLILDEFEAMLDGSRFDKEFFENLRELGITPEYKFGYLLASRQSLSELQRRYPDLESAAFGDIFGLPHAVGALQPEETTKPLRELWQRSLGKSLSQEDIARIQEEAGSHPALIHLLSREIWRICAGEHPLDSEQIKRQLWDYFRQLWEDRSQAEKDALFGVLDGKTDPDNATLWDLRQRGLLTKDNALFSQLFWDFMTQSVDRECSEALARDPPGGSEWLNKGVECIADMAGDIAGAYL